MGGGGDGKRDRETERPGDGGGWAPGRGRGGKGRVAFITLMASRFTAYPATYPVAAPIPNFFTAAPYLVCRPGQAHTARVSRLRASETIDHGQLENRQLAIGTPDGRWSKFASLVKPLVEYWAAGRSAKMVVWAGMRGSGLEVGEGLRAVGHGDGEVLRV